MRTSRLQFAKRCLLLAAAALCPPSGTEAAENDIAVAVRPDVPVQNITFAELRKLLLGDRQFWSSSMRVTLLVRAPGAREREVMLKTVYQMSEAQFRQYWIAKVFRAEAASGPRVAYSTEMAAELTSAIPGALAFFEAGQVPKSLRVLKINGKLPGEKDYPLH